MSEIAFKCEVKEKIATISENKGYTLEVNLMSFNDREEKVDIRRWDRNSGRMLKGVSITIKETKELVDVLSKLLESRK